MKTKQPEAYLNLLKEGIPNAVSLFLYGGCYKLYKILKFVYSDAVAYYDGNHVITKIGDKFYDITGEVKPNERHLPVDGVYYTHEELIESGL